MQLARGPVEGPREREHADRAEAHERGPPAPPTRAVQTASPPSTTRSASAGTSGSRLRSNRTVTEDRTA